MKKTTWFYIYTLGIGYLIAKKRAKQLASQTNQNLKVTNQINFPIANLLNTLGGKENIVNVTATMNNLKVKLVDNQLVQVDQLKVLGAKGSFVSGEQITILFGDHSQAIAEQLKQA